MRYLSETVERAINELAKLPGIGRKSAQRLVFYLLRIPKEKVLILTKTLNELKENVRFCSICYNITESDPCPICTGSNRDGKVICVVEEANDILAIEKTNQYNGKYHVLGGALSPLDGIGPDELRIKPLLQRLHGDIQEIILAINPNAEGEATALYLAKLIKPTGIKITRIARGIPVGTDIEFADEITLANAIEGRTNL
ncbi:recombination protein RecR [candidate division KSB1 bacterium]|nr:recombination protein RecR [candidate division KSB1 bacterium]